MSRNMLEWGTSWLASQLRQHASLPVTYRRGDERIPIFATPGSSDAETDPDAEMRVDHTQRDWLVEASQLVLGGLHGMPEAGDRIEEVTPGRCYTWQVLTPDGRELPYAESDTGRSMFRIHTKLVSIQ